MKETFMSGCMTAIKMKAMPFVTSTNIFIILPDPSTFHSMESVNGCFQTFTLGRYKKAQNSVMRVNRTRNK